MIILEENFKWHLEAFASELFICRISFGPIEKFSSFWVGEVRVFRFTVYKYL